MKEEIESTYEEPHDGLLRITRAFSKHHGEGVWDAIQRHLTAIDRAFQRATRDLLLIQGERFSQTPRPRQKRPMKSSKVVKLRNEATRSGLIHAKNSKEN